MTVYVVCCNIMCVFSGFIDDLVCSGYIIMKALQLMMKRWHTYIHARVNREYLKYKSIQFKYKTN